MPVIAPSPATLEVSPGLWRIRLPFHLELNHVNVHLVRLRDGWMLVDCGVATPDSDAALAAGLEQAGIAWRDIRTVLITHCHPDHVGNLVAVLDRSRARLLMHRLEADLLARISQANDRGTRFDTLLPDWGTPPDLVAAIQRDMAGGWRQFQWRQPDLLLEGGETIDTALGPLVAILTPGHACGHVCPYSPDRRILISGDHLLPTITPNIGWIPDADPLADYFASLENTAALDAALALPSHGEPFDTPRQRAAATAEHHYERCSRILDALAEGTRTAHEIAVALWGDALSPFQHRFGLYEVMAHLVFLERRGQVSAATAGTLETWNISPPRA